jgi:hypothetical protein
VASYTLVLAGITWREIRMVHLNVLVLGLVLDVSIIKKHSEQLAYLAFILKKTFLS